MRTPARSSRSRLTVNAIQPGRLDEPLGRPRKVLAPHRVRGNVGERLGRPAAPNGQEDLKVRMGLLEVH